MNGPLNGVEVTTARTTCSLCEACCGAIMKIENDRIVQVTPDRDDPLSGGFICAKGAAIPELEADPDKLHMPMLRRNGVLQPATWDEAFAFIDERLSAILENHGRNAVASYMGNAAGHNLNLMTYIPHMLGSLQSSNIYSAASLDNMPRHVVSGLLFGNEMSIHVPDVDRCQLLWIIGANPAESNGSMMVAPGFLGRMQKLQARGGRVVVIDPRRTTTAKRADEHVSIRPGGDAAFLASVAHCLMKDGLNNSHAIELCGDLSALRDMLEPFSPQAVSNKCGIDVDTIKRLALELRNTRAAAVYGRMGTTTQAFSSLVCWLIDVVNILAGNLDVEGGAMFPMPLVAQDNSLGISGRGEGFSVGKWSSRVSKAPEALAQMPMACLAEEIETPGPGQVRALITIAGNPGSSSPDTRRMGEALEKLELLVCLDIYINETSSRADVILPSPPRLAKANYDLYLYKFALRSYGRYSSPYRPLHADERSDREILLRLTAIARGMGWDADIEKLDVELLGNQVAEEIKRPGSAIQGRDEAEIASELRKHPPLERWLDLGLRTGPFGDGFCARSGISLDTLLESPQGVDCGPLASRLPEILRTRSGRIELVHPIFTAELRRLRASLDVVAPHFVLVGRRQLRSNNSWMHNLQRLDHPTRNCSLQLNSEDATELGVVAGEIVRVSTGQGAIDVAVETTTDIGRGVVSLPHGWGHGGLRTYMSVASANPGVNINEIAHYQDVDPLTWTAQLNGFAVSLSKIDQILS